MSLITMTYAVYALAGTGITIWVGRKLDLHGVTFAKSGDRYDAETGPAMSHLLVTGFSLVAFGIVSLALGLGSNAQTVQQCVEALSSKLGWVIMIIGLLHFIMLTVFAAMGRRSIPAVLRTSESRADGVPESTVSHLVNRVHEKH